MDGGERGLTDPCVGVAEQAEDGGRGARVGCFGQRITAQRHHGRIFVFEALNELIARRQPSGQDRDEQATLFAGTRLERLEQARLRDRAELFQRRGGDLGHRGRAAE